MNQFQKKLLILVDGSVFLYRSYYAFPLLTNSAGEAIGAIYGVLNVLRKLIIKYKPTHFAVVFDSKEKNFRSKLFKEYKSNRSPMPENLSVQIEPLHSIIEAMGLFSISISGFEADDIIGTLAKKAEHSGYLVLISTNDKDMAQLVNQHTYLIDIINRTVLGPKDIIIRYGVSPELIVDLIALKGDSSDNIPGVPGIGEKTAKILIKRFGGIDTLYAKLNKISNFKFWGSKTITKKLKENREMAYLSYQLATIKTNVKLNFPFRKLKIKKPKKKS